MASKRHNSGVPKASRHLGRAPKGAWKQVGTTPTPDWMSTPEELQREVDQLREELELNKKDFDVIARNLARHILPPEVKTQERVDAVAANISTLVLADNPYRIIEADLEAGGLLDMAYIAELRARLTQEAEAKHG